WRLGLRRTRRVEARMAVERAAFEALAHEDPLTGLPNKRAFDDRLETELRRAAREYYPVALVALDLDLFKQINDTWGHPVGDAALYWGKAHGRGRAAIYTPSVAGGGRGQDSEEATRLRSLLSTLQALAKAVDATNRFTVGHSERVATYAVALARSFGFGEERL